MVTQIIHQADPKLEEEVKNQIKEMDRHNKDLMAAMMKQLEEQNQRREAEIKMILAEKDR